MDTPHSGHVWLSYLAKNWVMHSSWNACRHTASRFKGMPDSGAWHKMHSVSEGSVTKLAIDWYIFINTQTFNCHMTSTLPRW